MDSRFKSEYEAVLDRIKPHILEYLEEKGYDTKAAISCINPDHEDKHPSMLVSNAKDLGWTISCRSCGWYGDIFNVYSILENKPSRGPGWLQEVVKPLAKKYGVVLPKVELTPEQRFRFSLYSVYEDVANLLNHDISKMEDGPREYVKSHGWTPETLEKLDIGTLDLEELSKYISIEEIKRFGLNTQEVFSNDNLIFTVRDRFARPIRFFARTFNKEHKFTSTTTRKLPFDIWRDQGHLYLSHLITRKSSKATILEGQSDCVTLFQNGMRNVVGLMGCENFNSYHEETLSLLGISDITLILDGDTAGREATKKILTSDEVKGSSAHYSVVSLPDSYDPDSYVREFGINQLLYLIEEASLSAFEFLLTITNPEQGVNEICDMMLPYIAASKSEIARERMARMLAEFTQGEASIGAILSDVRRLDQYHDVEYVERQKTISETALKSIKRNPESAKNALLTALEEIEEIEHQTEALSSIQNRCLSRLTNSKFEEEAGRAGGYILTKSKFGNLSNLLEGGDWKRSRVIIIGAAENQGKSSYLDALITDILKNPENDSIIYLLTIDDQAEDRHRRMICNFIDDLTFEQNFITNPKFYAEKMGIPDVYERREFGYAKLREAFAAGKLIIEDERDGRTISYVEKRAAQIRRENPDKDLIVALDNLHDCADYSSSDSKDRMSRIIKQGKRIAKLQKSLFICTAEYRKGDPTVPGTDEDLAESRSLKYAPHLTLHLFSDLGIRNAEKATLIHKNGGRILPRLTITPGKNKISDKKGIQYRMYTDFFPGPSLFKAVREEVAIKQIRNREEEIAGGNFSEKK